MEFWALLAIWSSPPIAGFSHSRAHGAGWWQWWQWWPWWCWEAEARRSLQVQGQPSLQRDDSTARATQRSPASKKSKTKNKKERVKEPSGSCAVSQEKASGQAERLSTGSAQPDSCQHHPLVANLADCTISLRPSHMQSVH